MFTYVAAFNPKNSFDAFKFESSMELANAYPSDLIQMSQTILVLSFIFTLINVRAEARFAQLDTISELGRFMVDT